MTDPIQTAHDRAQAAIKALADAGHRMANEHAHALDALRAEVEALRVQNAHLRHKCEAQEVGLVNLRRSDQDLRLERAALRERLAALDVAAPVDTEAP
jgi:FtsZ-binding cell division protein ZapB